MAYLPDVVRALVPHMPGVLHALVPHVLCVPCAVLSYVLSCLTCCVTYVPHMPRTLGGLVSLVTHLLQVHHAKHTTCISYLVVLVPPVSYVFNVLVKTFFFPSWTTVNYYDKQLLLKEKYCNSDCLYWI